MISADRIDLRFLDVLFAANYCDQSYMDDVWQFLKGHDYVLWDLFPFLHTRAGRLWTANSIFVSPATAVLLDPD